MVEDVAEWSKGARYLVEIDDPAKVRVDVALHMDFDAVRVTVEAGAFVAFGDKWEVVCSLERELLGDFH